MVRGKGLREESLSMVDFGYAAGFGIVFALIMGPSVGWMFGDVSVSLKEKIGMFLLGLAVCFVFGAVAGLSCLAR